jgi:hypothetical protein
LEAISRVLLLDTAQREHLDHLARPPRRRNSVRATAHERLDEATAAFLATLTVPALVMTRSTQVIGWNDLARAVFVDFAALPERERNTAWLLFLDEDLAARHRDWEGSARETVGILRMAAGENPDRLDLTALVGELAMSSETFRRLWAEHHVHQKASGVKPLRHPELGDFELTYITWNNPAAPDQMLVTYTPEPGSYSAEKLDLLGSMMVTSQ